MASAAEILLGVGLGLVAVVGYFVFASFAFGAGYQPTPRRSVEAMLRLAEVGPRDTVYDLGAGTGAIVFRAARTYRARVVGVEVEPIRVAILRGRRSLGPFADRITIRWGNFFALDFHHATVVSAFLWPGAMARLRPKLEAELPPNARIVSHCHPIVGWTPEAYDAETDVYLYRRPAAPGATTSSAPATGGT
ncbi:MAG: SAM-dependent methyltransferase [Thermoplasmata archaeon]